MCLINTTELVDIEWSTLKCYDYYRITKVNNRNHRNPIRWVLSAVDKLFSDTNTEI